MVDVSGTNNGDNLQGTSVADVIRGLGGNDSILGGAGDDRLVGGEGNDSLDGEYGNDKLFGGNGDDWLYDWDGGNDQLYGESGDDHLHVQRFYSHSANTIVLDGGAGDDTIEYGSAVYIVDRVTVSGGEGNDVITVAPTAKAVIDAGTGNDKVNVAMGGLNQTITLGAGADTFKITGTPYSTIRDVVRVTDFNTAEDRVDLTDIIGYLQNWDGSTNPFATGHLQLVQSGADSIFQIDRDGNGDNWTDLAIFEGVPTTGLNLDGFIIG